LKWLHYKIIAKPRKVSNINVYLLYYDTKRMGDFNKIKN